MIRIFIFMLICTIAASFFLQLGQYAQYYDTVDNDRYSAAYAESTYVQRGTMMLAAKWRCYPGELMEDFSCKDGDEVMLAPA